MRRFAIASAAALALAGIGAGPVSAQGPTPNGHNCAGLVVSSLARPGFGHLVSAAARQQAVDNFGLANCGQTNRKNP